MEHRKNIDTSPGKSTRAQVARGHSSTEAGVRALGVTLAVGRALRSRLALDGIDDYAHIPDNATLHLGVGAAEDFTIETSFYVSEPSRATNQLLIYKNNAYSVFFNANGLLARLYVAIGSYVQLQHLQPLSSGWNHVAAVFDNEYTANQDLFAPYVVGSPAASDTLNLQLAPQIPREKEQQL